MSEGDPDGWIEETGRQLRLARGLRGATQAELAKQAGVSVSTFRNWERARNAPRAVHVAFLREALDLSTEEVEEHGLWSLASELGLACAAPPPPTAPEAQTLAAPEIAAPSRGTRTTAWLLAGVSALLLVVSLVLLVRSSQQAELDLLAEQAAQDPRPLESAQALAAALPAQRRAELWSRVAQQVPPAHRLRAWGQALALDPSEERLLVAAEAALRIGAFEAAERAVARARAWDSPVGVRLERARGRAPVQGLTGLRPLGLTEVDDALVLDDTLLVAHHHRLAAYPLTEPSTAAAELSDRPSRLLRVGERALVQEDLDNDRFRRFLLGPDLAPTDPIEGAEVRSATLLQDGTVVLGFGKGARRLGAWSGASLSPAVASRGSLVRALALEESGTLLVGEGEWDSYQLRRVDSAGRTLARSPRIGLPGALLPTDDGVLVGLIAPFRDPDSFEASDGLLPWGVLELGPDLSPRGKPRQPPEAAPWSAPGIQKLLEHDLDGDGAPERIVSWSGTNARYGVEITGTTERDWLDGFRLLDVFDAGDGPRLLLADDEATLWVLGDGGPGLSRPDGDLDALLAAFDPAPASDWALPDGLVAFDPHENPSVRHAEPLLSTNTTPGVLVVTDTGPPSRSALLPSLGSRPAFAALVDWTHAEWGTGADLTVEDEEGESLLAVSFRAGGGGGSVVRTVRAQSPPNSGPAGLTLDATRPTDRSTVLVEVMMEAERSLVRVSSTGGERTWELAQGARPGWLRISTRGFPGSQEQAAVFQIRELRGTFELESSTGSTPNLASGALRPPNLGDSSAVIDVLSLLDGRGPLVALRDAPERLLRPTLAGERLLADLARLRPETWGPRIAEHLGPEAFGWALLRGLRLEGLSTLDADRDQSRRLSAVIPLVPPPLRDELLRARALADLRLAEAGRPSERTTLEAALPWFQASKDAVVAVRIARVLGRPEAQELAVEACRSAPVPERVADRLRALGPTVWTAPVRTACDEATTTWEASLLAAQE